MLHKTYISLLFLFFSAGLWAQQQDTQRIRIADTLSVKEKANRNVIILQTELDSLVKQYNDSQIQKVTKEPKQEKVTTTNQYVLLGLLTTIALLGFVIYLFYQHQKKISRVIFELNQPSKEAASKPGNELHIISKEKKGKMASKNLESRINELNTELSKLSAENDGLNRMIKEYNGIQHEYDSLKKGFLNAYKVKNYPDYDKSKEETLAIKSVLDTENIVAAYAYENFLKPILTITDANKNSPAKLSVADREKLLDMLVSLSLLYIEYLYLRVNELSIGGKMVERIKNFSKGGGPEVGLLKKLSTEFGSRALVMRMALDKAELNKLSYPVFDETNLNSQ